jgi:hypothetical protein
MQPQPQRVRDLDLLHVDLVALDLQIEHDGHRLELTGSHSRLVAKFPTLPALFHYGRLFRLSRNWIPQNASLYVEWRPFRVLLKRTHGKDANE